MQLLVIGAEHPVTQKLISQLTLHHQVTTVTPQTLSSAPNLTVLQDQPASNGHWLSQVTDSIECIINTTFPEQPAGHQFDIAKQSARILSITRNLINVSKKRNTPIIQPIPITTYASNGNNPVNIGQLAAEHSVGWGRAYAPAVKLLAATSNYHPVMFGQILYNSAAHCYSAHFPQFLNNFFPISHTYNPVTLTHADDLIVTITKQLADLTNHVMQFAISAEQITQSQALALFAAKHNCATANFALPYQLAHPLLSSTLSQTWSSSFVIPKQATDQNKVFLSYPTLKSGLGIA